MWLQLQNYSAVQRSVTEACTGTDLPKEAPLTLPPWFEMCNEQCPVTIRESIQIEKETVDQASCAEWHKHRSHRITASDFHRVTNRKQPVTTQLLHSIFKPQSFTSAATTYGINSEARAKESYLTRVNGAHLHRCGLCINPAFSFLGASPDAKVCHNGETGIVEVKCPYTARDMTLGEACQNIVDFCLEIVDQDGCTVLKRSHKYYVQVQGQLLVSGNPFVILLCISKKTCILRELCQIKP